jgi:hypothetical protein
MTTWGYGNAGWVRIDDGDLPGPLYVRVRFDGGARPVITEMYLDGRGRELTAAHLEMLNPTRLAAGVAGDGDADYIRQRETFPGSDLSRLASHYATTFGKARHWVQESMHAQIAGSGVPQAPMGAEPRAVEDVEPVLTIPESRALTHEFLRQVAEAYGWAIRHHMSPGTYVARRTGANIHTVRGWFTTARRRGVMAPGKAGRIV